MDRIFITKDYAYMLILPFIDEKEAISSKIYIWFNEKYDDKLKTHVATFPQDGDDSKMLLNTFKKNSSIQN